MYIHCRLKAQKQSRPGATDAAPGAGEGSGAGSSKEDWTSSAFHCTDRPGRSTCTPSCSCRWCPHSGPCCHPDHAARTSAGWPGRSRRWRRCRRPRSPCRTSHWRREWPPRRAPAPHPSHWRWTDPCSCPVRRGIGTGSSDAGGLQDSG